MKKLIFLLSIVSFSCTRPALETVNSSNPNIELELIFEKDGCKMYRFYEGNRYIYWVDCRGQVVSSYDVHQNKTNITKYDQSITSK